MHSSEIWIGFCCVISLLLCREMLRISPNFSRAHSSGLYFCTVVLYGLKWLFLVKTKSIFVPTLGILLPLGILLVVCCLLEIFQKDFTNTIERISWPLFCFVYASFFLSFMVDLSLFELSSNLSVKGRWFVLYVFTSAWMCDTGALIWGKYFGGKLLNISCSPTKTWIGLFGGIGSSMLGVMILRWIVIIKNDSSFVSGGFFDPVYTKYFICVSLGMSLLAIIGDLFESAIKRSNGKKDSGSAIPGHGGIFDVLDSCILTCVFFYITLHFCKFS